MMDRRGCASRGDAAHWQLLSLALILVLSPAATAEELEPAAGPEPLPRAPEVRDFFPELGRNLWRLRDPQNLQTLAFGTLAVGGAHTVDDQVEDYLSEKRRARAVGEVGHVLGNPAAVGGASAALLLIAYRGDDLELRAFSFDLAQGFVVNDILTRGLKAAIDRERPNGENRNSFPSGHSSAAFTVAAVVDHHRGRTASVLGYTVASFVALSRLEKNKHHLSDVVAGAVQGLIVGQSVTRREQAERRVQVTPVVGFGEVGAMVALRW